MYKNNSKKMKKIVLIIILFSFKCLIGQNVEVLNFATFHMTFTPDANKIKFEDNEKFRLETYDVVKMLAVFKPTIICVEVLPSKNDDLNNDYLNFLNDKNYKTKYEGEIRLLAYEVGKLAGVKKIYGIDEQETAQYDYNIQNKLKNQIDTLTLINYKKNFLKDFAIIEKQTTKNKLKFFNSEETLEKLINLNADILTYISTKNNFEGADEASKFYRRNLRIFSNINKIPVGNNDRVLIIMGATHTAFLKEFLKRSPKYQLLDVTKYFFQNE